MSSVFIYALHDPDTGHVRYIGKSYNLKKRFSSHLSHFKNENCHRANWIGKLLSLGKKPIQSVIAEVPENSWSYWECEYIRRARSFGFDLVNNTGGGEGAGSGKNHPNFGKRLPDITRLRMSAARVGRVFSEETRDKLRLANTGRKISEETRERLRTSHLGIKHTPETFEKRSESLTLAWKKRKEKNVQGG